MLQRQTVKYVLRPKANSHEVYHRGAEVSHVKNGQRVGRNARLKILKAVPGGRQRRCVIRHVIRGMTGRQEDAAGEGRDVIPDETVRDQGSGQTRAVPGSHADVVARAFRHGGDVKVHGRFLAHCL